MVNERKTPLSKRLYGSLPALFLFLLFVLVASLYAGVSRERERLAAEKRNMARKERPPVNVVVQELAPGPVRERINLPGVIEPWVDLNLLVEVRGTVVDVPVTEGARVKQGDLLALIDDRDYRNTLQSVMASYDLAVTDHKRLARLFEQGIVARSEVDTIEARVKVLAAEKETAVLQLERCRVVSPISGVVNRLPAEKGQYLSVGDPIARILTIDPVKVAVGIPESDIDAVRRLSQFEIVVDALGGRSFMAAKHFLAVAPESMAQIYRLELALRNDDTELLPGMFARVEIVKQQITDGLSIPLYAVVSRDDRNIVYVEEDGTARSRQVELGILEGWRVQVVEGLAPGQRVIVVGQRDVDDGQRVQVIRTVAGREIVR